MTVSHFVMHKSRMAAGKGAHATRTLKEKRITQTARHQNVNPDETIPAVAAVNNVTLRQHKEQASIEKKTSFKKKRFLSIATCLLNLC